MEHGNGSLRENFKRRHGRHGGHLDHRCVNLAVGKKRDAAFMAGLRRVGVENFVERRRRRQHVQEQHKRHQQTVENRFEPFHKM